jgi:hypothetical protein
MGQNGSGINGRLPGSESGGPLCQMFFRVDCYALMNSNENSIASGGWGLHHIAEAVWIHSASQPPLRGVSKSASQRGMLGGKLYRQTGR